MQERAGRYIDEYKCEVVAIRSRGSWIKEDTPSKYPLLRFQCAVVYLYAALWKCHPDWVGGLCCRSLFLLLEQQGLDLPLHLPHKMQPALHLKRRRPMFLPLRRPM